MTKYKYIIHFSDSDYDENEYVDFDIEEVEI